MSTAVQESEDVIIPNGVEYTERKIGELNDYIIPQEPGNSNEENMIKNVYESEHDLEEEREDLKTETIESKLKKLEIDGDTEKRIRLKNYENEKDMPEIMRLITKDLSEPYSIYTYRYFIHNWPNLCFLAFDEDKCIGAIVCKLDWHKKIVHRGYIAMLAVDEDYRRRKIGSRLVIRAIQAMVSKGADEIVLETEVTNKSALNLYENLGFVRDKRLFRYYLNGIDALRLKLWIR